MKLIDKIDFIKKKFHPLTPMEKYNLLMEMGQKLEPFPKEMKIEKNRVVGCQSELYLSSKLTDGKLFFYADSDALISKGLAALLIFVYSGESPNEILNSSPTFLKEIGILGALSPSRSNGLAQLYHRIQKDAANSLLV